MKQTKKFLIACVASAVVGLSAISGAAAFPEAGRTLTLIVPFAAGGTTDVGGRLLAAALADSLGVVGEIVNRPGATTQIGNTVLTQAAPDGYTLVLASLPSLSMTYLDAERGAPYDRNSFTPIAHYMAGANVLAVTADKPYQTATDLIAAAQAAPNTIRVGTVGLMSNSHLPGIALEQAADVDFAFVHFDGAAPMITALLAGDVDVAIHGVQTTVPHVSAGTVRVLGYYGTERTRYFPDLETLIEQGIDVSAPSSFAVLGPAGMDPETVAILSEAIKAAMDDADFQARAMEIGLELEYMDPETLSAFWDNFDAQQAVLIELARAED